MPIDEAGRQKLALATAMTAIAIDGAAAPAAAAAAGAAATALHFDATLGAIASVAFDVPYELALMTSLWLLANHGKRGYFRGSLLGYATGCVAAALAPSAAVFLIARIVQGACLGGLFASGLFTIVGVAKPQRLPMLFAIFTLVALAAPTLGPALDGMALAIGGWRAGFAILAVAPLVAGILASLVLIDPEPPAPKFFDTASFLALALVLLPVHHLFEASALDSVERSVEIAVAIVAAAWLIVREVALARVPFVDITPLRDRYLRLALIGSLFAGVALGTTAAIVPFAAHAYGNATAGVHLAAIRFIGEVPGAFVVYALWRRSKIDNRTLAIAGLLGFALTLFAGAAASSFADSQTLLAFDDIVQGFALALLLGPLASLLFGAASQTQFAPLALLFKIALVVGSALATPLGTFLDGAANGGFARLWSAAATSCIVAAIVLATAAKPVLSPAPPAA